MSALLQAEINVGSNAFSISTTGFVLPMPLAGRPYFLGIFLNVGHHWIFRKQICIIYPQIPASIAYFNCDCTQEKIKRLSAFCIPAPKG